MANERTNNICLMVPAVLLSLLALVLCSACMVGWSDDAGTVKDTWWMKASAEDAGASAVDRAFWNTQFPLDKDNKFTRWIGLRYHVNSADENEATDNFDYYKPAGVVNNDSTLCVGVCNNDKGGGGFSVDKCKSVYCDCADCCSDDEPPAGTAPMHLRCKLLFKNDKGKCHQECEEQAVDYIAQDFTFSALVASFVFFLIVAVLSLLRLSDKLNTSCTKATTIIFAVLAFIFTLAGWIFWFVEPFVHASTRLNIACDRGAFKDCVVVAGPGVVLLISAWVLSLPIIVVHCWLHSRRHDNAGRHLSMPSPASHDVESQQSPKRSSIPEGSQLAEQKVETQQRSSTQTKRSSRASTSTGGGGGVRIASQRW